MAKTPTPKTPAAALEKYIKEFDLSISGLALELGQNNATFKKILDGSKRITVEMALLLAKKFGTTADFWIDLQKKAALVEAKNDEKFQQRIKEIKKAVKTVKTTKDAVVEKLKRGRGRPASKPVVADKKHGRKRGRKVGQQNNNGFSYNGSSDS
jgi:addiction module HigA family antidote